MNKAFDAFFGENKPVRTTIGAQLLNIDVEIDVVVAM
jgi:enamine deaminase RidA (YjgF/YER057c/UK114 family)